MSFSISAIMPQGTGQSVEIGHALPDVCPRCHRHIHPQPLTATMSPDVMRVQVVFRCVVPACAEIFIGNYVLVQSAGRYMLNSLAPKTAVVPAIPETIKAVSTRFVTVYSQASEAEAHGLDEMFGIGLRKALEFLVKDYAIAEHPDKEAEIQKARLGKCIEDYVEDRGARECAKRAAWLGNDETHYLRVWVDRDINDLKMLLTLTMNWMNNAMLTKQYLGDMPE